MKVLHRSGVGPCPGIAALTVASLLYANPVRANAAMVEAIVCEASSQKARITIDLNGRDATDVQVIVSSFGSRPGKPLRTSLSIDKSGLVILPHLAPGQYLIAAGAGENRGGSLWVEISKEKWKEVSSLSLALHPLPPDSPTLERLLTASGKKAPIEQIQQFQGVVVDPSGAPVLGTGVQIYPKGARVRDNKHAVKVKTDPRGDFSVALRDGVYTAVFIRAGFQPKIVTFEISHTRTTNELRISLQLGMAT
jgi:hypothetical protein